MSPKRHGEEIDRLAGRLAACTGVNKAGAIEQALHNELSCLEGSSPLPERLRPIQERIQQRPLTGNVADKDFYDELNDEH